LWERRRNQFLQRTNRPLISLSHTLIQWLTRHTLDDIIDDKILVSIRESLRIPELHFDGSSDYGITRIQKIVRSITSGGLMESAEANKDGELIRVHFRCRTSTLKDLTMKLIRSLLSLEGFEEVSREEGVATAIIRFGRTTSLYV
jgi:hypothetical protein